MRQAEQIVGLIRDPPERRALAQRKGFQVGERKDGFLQLERRKLGPDSHRRGRLLPGRWWNGGLRFCPGFLLGHPSCFPRFARRGSLPLARPALLGQPRHVLHPPLFLFHPLLFLALQAAVIFLEIGIKFRLELAEDLVHKWKSRSELRHHHVDFLLEQIRRRFAGGQRRLLDQRRRVVDAAWHASEHLESVAPDGKARQPLGQRRMNFVLAVR